MTTARIDLSPDLHQFPLPPEVQGLDFVDLAGQAQARLGDRAAAPLEESEVLSHGSNRVFVKRTDELPGGCFKFLSARNAVADLTADGHDEFVLATAGSYGVGVGHAIGVYGGEATAYVPAGTSDQKQTAMEELGVEVVEVDGNFDETLEVAQREAERAGKQFLHPYANVANLGGTGVLGLQIAKELPDATHVVLQFGGGSLTAGVASVLKQLRPDINVTVAQAAGCSPFVDSVLSGEVRESQDVAKWGTSYFRKLGGVGVGKTDPLTLGIASQKVDTVTTPRIDHIYATSYEYDQVHGVLPEVAAAVGLTAARNLARQASLEGAKIVAFLTGARADSYKDGYLRGMYLRREDEEGRPVRRGAVRAPALT